MSSPDGESANPRPSLVVLGATGAVGSQAVAAAIVSRGFAVVTTLGRRALTLPMPSPTDAHADPRVVQHIVDVADPKTYESHLAGHDVAICTLGLGQPSKTSKEEFQRVDRDCVLAFAQACRRQGTRHFTLLPAVGANPASSVFYLRVKGEIEALVRELRFERTTFFRPSMLLTDENRYGWSQGLMLAMFPRIEGLLAGPLRKYRGIRVDQLGRAMITNALRATTSPGVVEIHEWDAIKALLA